VAVPAACPRREGCDALVTVARAPVRACGVKSPQPETIAASAAIASATKAALTPRPDFTAPPDGA